MKHKLVLIMAVGGLTASVSAASLTDLEDMTHGNLVFAGKSVELSMKKPGMHSYVKVDLGDGEAVGVDDDAYDDEQSKLYGAIHWLIRPARPLGRRCL